MEALLVPHDGAERRLPGAARRLVDLAELYLPDLHDWDLGNLGFLGFEMRFV